MTASTNLRQTTPPKAAGRKRVFVLRVAAGVVVVATIAWGVHSLFFAGVNPGPSLIQELRTGAITESGIQAIEILKFDPGAGWPFSEREYARKARKRLATPEPANELVSILRESTTDGHKHRNHPSTFYYGILRIELVDGGHYYVIYHLGYYNGEYYAYADTNSRNSTNPNGARNYENVPLAKFLKEHDPWYRDADSPASPYRPSAPDDVP